MDIGDLIGGNKTWVHVSLRTIRGAGRLNPHLVLVLKLATPSERVEAELRDVELRVALGDELLGVGRLIGEPVFSYGTDVSVEVPVSHRTIDFITDAFGRADALSLQLRWYGSMRVKSDPKDGEARYAGDPEPGEWTDYPLPLLRLSTPLENCAVVPGEKCAVVVGGELTFRVRRCRLGCWGGCRCRGCGACSWRPSE